MLLISTPSLVKTSLNSLRGDYLGKTPCMRINFLALLPLFVYNNSFIIFFRKSFGDIVLFLLFYFLYPAVFWEVIPDSHSFLFTLVHPSGNELIKINPKSDSAIRCRSDLGPSFGNSTHFDLLVWDLDYRSYLNLDHGFTYPETVSENTYLAGDPFEVSELEVFQVNL